MREGDIVLRCSDCGANYIYSRGEQAFYQLRGLDPPKRCHLCRKERRKAKKAWNELYTSRGAN